MLKRLMDNNEKALEKKLVALSKKNGGLCIKLLPYQFIGLPDRILLFPRGKIVFVELKTEGQKPRKAQIIVHNTLRNLGFRVEVIDTVEKLNFLINSVI